MQEIDILVSHLKYHPCKKKETSCSFFEQLFNNKVQISILGYSIGSLVAISHFLQNTNKYVSCFSLSGGMKIEDLTFPSNFIDQNTWKQFTEELHKKATRVNLKKENKYYKHFLRVFLGDQQPMMRNELEKHSKKILFIFGGKDQITPFGKIEKIEPDKEGLSMLKISGLDHILPIEKEWGHWLETIVNLIIKFKENAMRDFKTAKESIEALIKFDRKYKLFKHNPNLFDKGKLISNPLSFNQISNNKDRMMAERIYFSCLAYYNEEELIEETNKEYSKTAIGKILMEKGWITAESINSFAQQLEKGTLLGNLLTKNRIISENQLNVALKEQESFYL